MSTLDSSLITLAPDPGLNVTTRRVGGKKPSKMASTLSHDLAPERYIGGSILLDSILSQAEETEVNKMLEMEGEVMDDLFPITSTQMITHGQSRKDISLSPILRHDYENPSCQGTREKLWLEVSNRFAPLGENEDSTVLENFINHELSCGLYKGTKVAEGRDEQGGIVNNKGEANLDVTAGRALHGPLTSDARSVVESDPATGRPVEVGTEVTRALHNNAEIRDEAGSEMEIGTASDPKNEEGGESGSEDGDARPEDVINMSKELRRMTVRVSLMDKLLSDVGDKSDELTVKVGELQASLEFSQLEVDTLKGENQTLRQKLADLEIENSRSTYQMKKMEEKIDKVDTYSRRRNLIFEGIPEAVDGKEDVEKTI